MKRPNLLMSVTGGAKDFTLKPGLMDVFRHGLVKAAESTGILMYLCKDTIIKLYVKLLLSDVCFYVLVRWIYVFQRSVVAS